MKKILLLLSIIIIVIAIIVYNKPLNGITNTGTAMEPTIKDGEKFLYKNKEYYGRGDVVVIHKESVRKELLLKRIVGLPGETIEIRNNLIYINNNILKEDYTIGNNETFKFKQLTLGANEYFVMGDNRTTSFDSRIFGPITSNDILGSINYKYR